jgi:hypothetical protein
MYEWQVARSGSPSSNSITWFGLMCCVAVNGDRAGGGVARCVVGVDGIGEAIGEHHPVAAVDAHGVPNHLLADLDAVFEAANASFEVGGHTSPPFRRSRFQRPATTAPRTGAAGPSATTG